MALAPKNFNSPSRGGIPYLPNWNGGGPIASYGNPLLTGGTTPGMPTGVDPSGGVLSKFGLQSLMQQRQMGGLTGNPFPPQTGAPDPGLGGSMPIPGQPVRGSIFGKSMGNSFTPPARPIGGGGMPQPGMPGNGGINPNPGGVPMPMPTNTGVAGGGRYGGTPVMSPPNTGVNGGGMGGGISPSMGLRRRFGL